MLYISLLKCFFNVTAKRDFANMFDNEYHELNESRHGNKDLIVIVASIALVSRQTLLTHYPVLEADSRLRDSSASSNDHGGLRYLEHYECSVSEALAYVKCY